MILLNFGHRLSDEQRREIEGKAGGGLERVVEVKVDLNLVGDLAAQIRELVHGIDLTAAEWANGRLLVNPPGFAPAAAVLVAELHGRTGYFPEIVWLRPVEGEAEWRYEVAEVVDLRKVREGARKARWAGGAAAD